MYASSSDEQENIGANSLWALISPLVAERRKHNSRTGVQDGLFHGRR